MSAGSTRVKEAKRKCSDRSGGLISKCSTAFIADSNSDSDVDMQ